jgi:hypothetical protein
MSQDKEVNCKKCDRNYQAKNKPRQKNDGMVIALDGSSEHSLCWRCVPQSCPQKCRQYHDWQIK